jgi:hypothetical protein
MEVHINAHKIHLQQSSFTCTAVTSLLALRSKSSIYYEGIWASQVSKFEIDFEKVKTFLKKKK